MEKVGKVIKTEKSMATIIVMRSSSCGENCIMCRGCAKTSQTVIVNNSLGAKTGDMVKIELDDKKVLLAAFFVYIVPLITLIIGYAIYSFAGGILGFVLPYFILKALDKKSSQSYTASITKIFGGSL